MLEPNKSSLSQAAQKQIKKLLKYALFYIGSYVAVFMLGEIYLMIRFRTIQEFSDFLSAHPELRTEFNLYFLMISLPTVLIIYLFENETGTEPS